MNNRIITAMLLSGNVPAACMAADKKPNILLIVVDDMGYSDIGCYGSEIRTPTIDRLAQEGIRFTHFYSNPRSCPSRASLMTGLYSVKAGVGNMDNDWGVPGYRGYLNRRSVTLAEALGAAGYDTYMAGKWHLGTQKGQWPDDRGFNHTYALLPGGANYFRPGNMVSDGKRIQIDDPDFYMTDAISNRAVEYVRQAADSENPFFMYVAYTAVHVPLQAPRDQIAKYAGHYDAGWDKVRAARYTKMKQLGILDPGDDLSPRYGSVPDWGSLSPKQKKDWALRMSIYAAMLDVVDQGVGRIVAELEKTGALDNTLIVFTSDNGANPYPSRKTTSPDVVPGDARSSIQYEANWANTSNAPYRLFKRTTHEGGISVPLIVRYPAAVRAGSMTSTVAHFIDFMPTFLDYAGGSYPEKFNDRNIHPVDGVSLRNTLAGDPSPVHDVLCWEHNGNRAVRKGDWKLVSEYTDGPQKWELYNMAADRTELHDLAVKHPEKVRELGGEYDAWCKANGVKTWEEQMRLSSEAAAKNKTEKQ